MASPSSSGSSADSNSDTSSHSTLNTTSSSLSQSRTPSSVSTAAVRTVPFKDYEKAAECLIQAFATDEVARYFVDMPDTEARSEDEKWKLHCDIMRYITAAHCLGGLVTAVGDEKDEFGAVALWLPPHASTDSLYTLVRSQLWRLHYKLSREGRHRFFTEFFPLLHETKHETLGDREADSYYLVYLGSKPSSRGKGYARLLIDHGCALADAQNRAIYLESSARTNIEYYKKFAFEEVRDIVLSRGSKPIYLHIMVREPNPAALAGSGKVGKGEKDEVKKVEDVALVGGEEKVN